MYEGQTEEVILKRMLENVPVEVDKREGSIVYDASMPAAIEFMLIYAMADYFLKNTFGDTADRAYLVERALERGMSPKEATYAKVKATFTPSTVEVPIGNTFSYDDLDYTVSEKVSAGVYYLICTTAGTVGNQASGTMIPNEFVKDLQTATLTEVTVPGEDEEDTEVFRARYLASFDSTAYGGNIADYKEKVNAINGVGGVKVYPVWSGGGTVRIVFMTSEYGVPTTSFVNEVQTVIDPVTNSGEGVGIAPIGHRVTVEGVKTHSITISMTITSTSLASELQSEIESVIDNYLLELNKTWESTKKDSTSLTSNTGLIVRIAQIEARVLAITSIEDVENLTLDGLDTNLTLGVDELAVRGDVNVTNS